MVILFKKNTYIEVENVLFVGVHCGLIFKTGLCLLYNMKLQLAMYLALFSNVFSSL